MLIEKRTEIDIERILTGEDDKEIIEYLKERGAANKLMLRDILINNILIIDPPLLLYETPDRPIIIGTDSMLISGLAKLKTYKHKELVIFGLILDYGVELIGLKLAEGGYKIYLPVDAVKPINEKNREPVMKELRAKGIEMWNTAAVIGELAAN